MTAKITLFTLIFPSSIVSSVYFLRGMYIEEKVRDSSHKTKGSFQNTFMNAYNIDTNF